MTNIFSRVGKPGKKVALIGAATVIGLTAVAGASYAWMQLAPAEPIVLASETSEIRRQDLEEKILTSGHIDAHRSTSLTTKLTGPVQYLKVALGDHVGQDQLLALMDTTALQRQLELEQATKASQDAGNISQLATARQQYQQLHEQYEQGLNPEINAAVAAERQAHAALEAAQTALANKQHDIAAGEDPVLKEQRAGLQAARDEQRDAALGLARTNFGNMYDIVVNDAVSPGPIFDAAETQDRVDRANRKLAEQERDYEHALTAIDRELAALAVQERDANAAYAEAVVAADSARLAALHRIDAQRVSVEQAEAAVGSGGKVAEVTSQHLAMDISNAEVRSPHGGVVTELNAKVGAPVDGVLLTVADDSKLKVTAKVKESEVAKIKPGMAVSFNTPTTKDKTFTGTVVHVAQVAGKTAEDDPTKSKVEFPVEIAVTGDTEGLRIGASSKVNVIVAKQPDALTVAREAVMKTDDGFEVIVFRPEGSSFRVAKVPVQVLAQNEFDAAISARDLNAGDKIARDPGKSAEHVDKLVRVEGQ